MLSSICLVHPDELVFHALTYTCICQATAVAPAYLCSLTASSVNSEVLIHEEGSGLSWETINQYYWTAINQGLVRTGDCQAAMETQSLSVWGALSLEGLVCVWESHESESPFLHSALIPEHDPTPPDLPTSQHPSCESLSDLYSPHCDPKPPPCPCPLFNTLRVRAPHTSRPAWESQRRAEGWRARKSEGASTFSGDEVEGPRFLWECRAGSSEEPTQQEEGRRGHGRHSNRTVVCWNIKKKREKGENAVSGC